MSGKRAEAKKTAKETAVTSGRISGLKVSRESCEFHIKGKKSGRKQFVVDGKNGLALESAVKVLIAVWEGKKKITVEPMAGEGLENKIASISLGSLRKTPKPPEAAKPVEPPKAANAKPVEAVAA
jgi:hypothetical protein